MKKVKFGKVKQVLKGRGFMIALVLSITAVGASTYIAYDQAISKIGLTDGGNDYVFKNEVVAPVGKGQDNIPKEDDSIAEVFTPVPDEQIAEEVNKFVSPKNPCVMPVEGEVSVPFSNGELVKSKTLGVWKTHDGADILAPVGTPVGAIANGTVSEVCFDSLWGVVVIIDHGDGVVASYKGLDKNVNVAAGQEVKAADIIGTIGCTAEIEIAEEPHLHLELVKNGDFIDPIEFITKRQQQ